MLSTQRYNRDLLILVQISVHGFAVCTFLFGIVYDLFYIDGNEIFKDLAAKRGVPFSTKGGKTKFLTQWNMYLQLGFYSVSLCCDLFSYSRNPQKLDLLVQIRDFVFFSVALPLTIYIVSIFWSIWAVDRELIFPSLLDRVYPWWLNHLKHTCPLVLIVMDMLITKHEYMPYKKALVGNVSVMTTYLVWILYIAYVAEVWVYPIFYFLNWIQKSIFLSGLSFYSAVCVYVGMKLNCCVWGGSPEFSPESDESSRFHIFKKVS